MYQELSVCKEYLRYWGCQYVDISKLGKHWITSLPFRSGKVRASRKIRGWLFRLIVMGRMDLTYIQCCAWYRYTMEILTMSNNGINNTCRYLVRHLSCCIIDLMPTWNLQCYYHFRLCVHIINANAYKYHRLTDCRIVIDTLIHEPQ